MANGTVTYQGYPTSSLQVISGQTSNIMNLTLSGSLAPTGATLTAASITVSANVSSRAIGFSPMIFGASGYYESMATGCKFSATGNVTESFELGIPSATAQAMAFTGGPQSFRFSGDSGASGLIICTLSTSNLVKIVISYQLPDPCAAPTSATVAPTVVESEPTLTFSGAKAGTGNTITGYEIQYAESSNGSSYGSWTSLKTISSTATSGSTTVGIPSVRGYFRKYRIKTQGSAGSAYYSDWKETNIIRRNMIPLGPTMVTASPSTFVDEQVTIQWSGASSTTSSIKGFMLARKNSADGMTFDSSWTVITSLTLAQASGSYTYSYTPTLGTYIKYGVWTIDSLDVYSGETVSNTIQRVTPTACTPPTTVTLTPAIVEATLTLAWSGAGSSAGNAIVGYTLQLSESADSVTWGDWQAFAIVDSTSTSGSFTGINPPSVRGAYRKLRIQTRGSAGASLYSAWAESNPARRNILPTPPTTFTASPETYFNTQITLAWSGTIPGTSSIKNYVLQLSTSPDGVSWSGWSALASILTRCGVTMPATTHASDAASVSSVMSTENTARINVTYHIAMESRVTYRDKRAIRARVSIPDSHDHRGEVLPRGLHNTR